MKKAFGSGVGLAALAAVLLVVMSPARAQSAGGLSGSTASVRPAAIIPVAVSIDLCAKAGEITLPGLADPVPIWGYVLGDCSDTSLQPSLPGPVINAIQGASVTVTLHNDLDEPTSIVFPGSTAEPQAAAPGGSVTYSFIAADPGTFLYQSGSNVTRQVAMGLYGALAIDSLLPGHAYATLASGFDSEAVLVLSEIDPDLNADPNGFNLLDWSPTYWLINGEAYPDTDAIPAPAGGKVLLRYVNASLDHHTMALLGEYQRIVAKDADPLEFPFDVVAETIPAGSTADMVVSVPDVPEGTMFPLYNRQLRITNGNAFPGGMLTFLTAQPALAPLTVGVVPQLTLLRASVRWHSVRVVARLANCTRCSANAKMRVRGKLRSIRMTLSRGRYVGSFARVRSGRWRYVVSVRDASTGIRVTAPARVVRVP